MLDVHPPHAPTHTWKDFFLHIATIVVGLLIAVGLEQTVEYFHHRHQVAEIHEALQQERELNRKNFAANAAVFRESAALLENDLLVLRYLQMHPGTAEEKLPGVLLFEVQYEPMIDVEWKTAKQTGVTALMSQADVTEDDSLYDHAANINSSVFDAWHDMNRASQYESVNPDLSQFTRVQIDEEIKLTENCITSLYQWGVLLKALGQDFPDFTVAPTKAEVFALKRLTRSPQDVQRLLPAQQQTDARVKSLSDARHAAMKIADAR